MRPALHRDADRDVGGEAGPDRFGVYAEFDRASSPELFAALGSIARGKQRAQRLRMLALKGWMFEQMEPMLSRARSMPLPAPPTQAAGAGDVFGAPLES